MHPRAAVAGLMKPHRALMALVFTVALAAGWSMLPGDSELIAMLERDGHSREALGILEGGYAKGDRRYRTLHQMLALYENEGNTIKAREVMEQMVAQRPRDPALRDRLARFYRAIGDGGARAGALKSQIETRYNEAACRELIAMRRLEGMAQNEIAALQLCRQRGYRRPDDLARLAELVAASGDTSQAASLLRAIDDVKRLKTSEERYFLLALLLEQSQPKEAERRAVRWIKSSKDHALAVGLIDALARSKYPDTALGVAKDAGESGDSISLTVAERFLERSQPQAAQNYLRGWLDNAAFDNEEVATRFVTAAIEAADPKTALAGARKFGLSKLPAPIAGDLAKALDNALLKAEAAEVRGANTRAAGSQAEPPGDGKFMTPERQYGPWRTAPSRTSSGPKEQAMSFPPGDPLEAWRRSLSAKMAEDAQRKATAQGHPLPRHFGGGHFDHRSHATARVLKATTRVLQRTKRLKSLKLKQKLVRERAAKKPRA
ncbi:MAG: hypothetical protein ABL907_08790 [Hyphomicrobium sp.]